VINPADFSDFLASRRTSRSFLPTRLDPQIIDALITDGLTSPSWSNTRPYMVAVASGEVRDRISADLLKRWEGISALRNGGLKGKLQFAFNRAAWPLSDYNMAKPYVKALLPRAQRVGKELYGLLGVPRGDKKARDDQWANNYQFFGAPTVIFVFIHKSLGVFAANDAGLFAQNLMLSAHARGLGTCAQGAVAMWPDAIRAEFDVPDGYKLIYGISLGYRTDAPVNGFGAHRISADEIKIPKR
jgi:nitroreductase